jgi:hypothetical protein
MRTRRSPRNQERLWRELAGKIEQPKLVIAMIQTDAEIDAMFWISKTSRNLLKRDAAKARRETDTGTVGGGCGHLETSGEGSGEAG